jgi:hypothetical protein
MSDDRIEGFSLWVARDNRWLTFRGHLLARCEGAISPANTVPQVTIYRDTVGGGYIAALAELMPEEIQLRHDDLKRRANLKAAYGHAWPRSTVNYAERFLTLEAIAESEIADFADSPRAARRAVKEAIRQAESL